MRTAEPCSARNVVFSSVTSVLLRPGRCPTWAEARCGRPATFLGVGVLRAGAMKWFAAIVPPVLVGVVLVGVVLFASASSSSAAPRVVGGTSIRIQAAPWVVFIRQAISGGSLLCSGSILDPLHVLTAAHCLYDRNGVQASINSLTVKAGVSNYIQQQAGDSEQIRQVSSLRVHPGYLQPAGVTPDDVAIIALSAPLDLSGPTATAIPLPAVGAAFPAGAEVGFAGYGRVSATTPLDGSLNWLAAKADAQGSCGGRSNAVITDAAAIAFCAISPNGTSCTGDSGSALVTTTGVNTLVGIVSAGPLGCTGGGATIVTYVGAPEILRFIQGDDQPPIAPRRTSSTFVDISWQGTLRVGNTLTCSSGNWNGEPTLTYAFVSSQTGQVLQQGPKGTYRLSAANVGDSLVCRAAATNAGGTAVLWTGSTKEIGPAPAIGIAPLRPVAAVPGRTVTVRVVLYAPSELTGKFAVCITPAAQVGKRVCASQRVDVGSSGGRPFKLRLRIWPGASRGLSPLAITAVAGISSTQKTALVQVAPA
jgi:hypothetical protein